MIKDFATGIIIGAIGGALAAVLLTPKSGPQMRHELMDTYKDMKHELTRKITRMTRLTKEKYHELVDSVVAGYEEAKKLTPEQAKEIGKILDDSYEQIRKALKEG